MRFHHLSAAAPAAAAAAAVVSGRCTLHMFVWGGQTARGEESISDRLEFDTSDIELLQSCIDDMTFGQMSHQSSVISHRFPEPMSRATT